MGEIFIKIDHSYNIGVSVHFYFCQNIMQNLDVSFEVLFNVCLLSVLLCPCWCEINYVFAWCFLDVNCGVLKRYNVFLLSVIDVLLWCQILWCKNKKAQNRLIDLRLCKLFMLVFYFWHLYLSILHDIFDHLPQYAFIQNWNL